MKNVASLIFHFWSPIWFRNYLFSKWALVGLQDVNSSLRAADAIMEFWAISEAQMGWAQLTPNSNGILYIYNKMEKWTFQDIVQPFKIPFKQVFVYFFSWRKMYLKNIFHFCPFFAVTCKFNYFIKLKGVFGKLKFRKRNYCAP